MNATTNAFDPEALRRGIEERDAGALRVLYAPDAEMTVVDRNTPPPEAFRRKLLSRPGCPAARAASGRGRPEAARAFACQRYRHTVTYRTRSRSPSVRRRGKVVTG